jgi:hypothetical protein
MANHRAWGLARGDPAQLFNDPRTLASNDAGQYRMGQRI